MRTLRPLFCLLSIATVLGACGESPVASTKAEPPNPHMDGGPFLGGGNFVGTTTTDSATADAGPTSGPFLGGGN